MELNKEVASLQALQQQGEQLFVAGSWSRQLLCHCVNIVATMTWTQCCLAMLVAAISGWLAQFLIIFMRLIKLG